jgi:hypothetical protein
MPQLSGQGSFQAPHAPKKERPALKAGRPEGGEMYLRF